MLNIGFIVNSMKIKSNTKKIENHFQRRRPRGKTNSASGFFDIVGGARVPPKNKANQEISIKASRRRSYALLPILSLSLCLDISFTLAARFTSLWSRVRPILSHCLPHVHMLSSLGLSISISHPHPIHRSPLDNPSYSLLLRLLVAVRWHSKRFGIPGDASDLFFSCCLLLFSCLFVFSLRLIIVHQSPLAWYSLAATCIF